MMTKMMRNRITAIVLTLCLFAPAAFAASDEKEEERVKDAGVVLKEILNIPDDIPQDLLDKAECVVVLPSVKKGAFGVGASYGRGVMVCRSGEHYTGPWGAPALYALEGVSIGFQLGGQATDFVLLVMNVKGARSLLSSKVKLGADASAAAGPKGRTAEGATDVVMNAEILSYSPEQGAICRGLSRRLDAGAFRRQCQRESVQAQIEREGNHRGTQSRGSSMRQSVGIAARCEITQEQVGTEITGIITCGKARFRPRLKPLQ